MIRVRLLYRVGGGGGVETTDWGCLLLLDEDDGLELDLLGGSSDFLITRELNELALDDDVLEDNFSSSRLLLLLLYVDDFCTRRMSDILVDVSRWWVFC